MMDGRHKQSSILPTVRVMDLSSHTKGPTIHLTDADPTFRLRRIAAGGTIRQGRRLADGVQASQVGQQPALIP